jgi:hypothetical protein
MEKGTFILTVEGRGEFLVYGEGKEELEVELHAAGIAYHSLSQIFVHSVKSLQSMTR